MMLNYILVYVNIILINVLILNCYNINNYSFHTLNFVIIGSMIVHYIFAKIIKKIPKKNLKFLFILTFICSITCTIYLNRENIYELILDLNNIGYYLISNIYAKRIIEFSEIRFFWCILLPVVVWLFMFLCNKKMEIFLFIFTIALGFYLNYAGFKWVFIDNINVFSFLMIFDIVVIYFIKRYLKNIQNENQLEVKYRSVMFIAAFVLISFLVFLFFNSSSMSMKYELNISDIGSNLNTDIRDLLKIADTEDSISGSGTSLIAFNNDEVHLGGDLRLNDGLVLTLRTEERIKYLRARTRDYYSGNSWKSTYKNYSTKEKDILDQYPDLDHEYSAEVFLSQYGNRRLVAPLYSYNYDNDNIRYNLNDFTCESNNVDISYSFNYYNEVFLYNDNYTKRERKYVQLPPNISESLRDLTEEIVKDAKNNEERIGKIVEYLRKNCKYSLIVDPVPKDREFIDYFVNTSKKGYCTYFATSVVIMLRIIGIESRYVEGYMVKDNFDDNGSYIVTNRDAHAWAEAKIDNNTWITVDAVPDGDLDIQFVQNNLPVELAPIEDEQYSNTTSELTQNTTTKQSDTSSKESTDNKTFNVFKAISGLKWYLKLTLTLFIIAVLFVFYKNLVFIYKKNKFINSRSINYCHIYFLSNLKKIGYKKNNNDTSLEFSETIKDEEIKNTFLHFINKFNREIYGNKNVNFTKEDRIKLFDYINDFYVNNTKLYERILSF